MLPRADTNDTIHWDNSIFIHILSPIISSFPHYPLNYTFNKLWICVCLRVYGNQMLIVLFGSSFFALSVAEISVSFFLFISSFINVSISILDFQTRTISILILIFWGSILFLWWNKFIERLSCTFLMFEVYNQRHLHADICNISHYWNNTQIIIFIIILFYFRIKNVFLWYHTRSFLFFYQYIQIFSYCFCFITAENIGQTKRQIQKNINFYL